MAYTTINKHTDYFNTKLYTGNASTNAITGVGFQPDWVWLKRRDASGNHNLYDAVRGVTKYIESSSTAPEQTQTYGLTAFDTDGFTLGSNTNMNGSGQTFASWNWKANGSGSSNTDGSITSTVSANTTAGFSIVTYTKTADGQTVGHGLGAKPKIIISKPTNATANWVFLPEVAGVMANKYLLLNSTDALQSDGNYAEPTSSVFTVSNNIQGNNTAVAYCFAEVPGYSKFGTYEGNQSADGTFVYTGFKPAFVLSKDIDAAGENWFIHDNKRNSFNPTNTYLRPNLSNGEGTAHHYDFYSNGFKNKYAGGSLNSSGRTYIYMAFGQSLVGSNNVPCTAR